MNYEETMAYIHNTDKFGTNYGLSRTEKILELLGNPHKELRCIHIAGTNGKGSTTAMLSKILLESGYKVGMYTSPYLEEFEERIQINNKNIDKEELSITVTKVSKVVEEVIALGYDHPTEFEIITCAMFLYFYEKNVDFAVIEVGLGGRLDSTNVITPILSIITSISYDHMNILGDTLSAIASEKAGIIKENVPLILYPQVKESEEVFQRVCEEKNSKLVYVKDDCVRFIKSDGKKQFITVDVSGYNYNICLNLLGKHQLLNCAVVLNAVHELRQQGIAIEIEHIEKALSKVAWTGRMEIMKDNPLVLIDGAHNIDAIDRLCESIDTYFNYENLYLILGILADKQVDEMVAKIAPKARKVLAVTPNSERAEIASELKIVIDKFDVPCEAFDNYEVALEEALKMCKDNDLLVISGSLYMIGDMRKLLRKRFW